RAGGRAGHPGGGDLCRAPRRPIGGARRQPALRVAGRPRRRRGRRPRPTRGLGQREAMRMPDAVTVERRGAVLEVTLDRPKANAIDLATSRALHQAFRLLQDDGDLRVAILTGAGERIFSAGWDLKAAASGSEAPDTDFGPGGFAGLTAFWDLTKPVIAAVNGVAIAGGCELALAADIMVVADHAEFALSEVTVGLVPDAGGIQRLPRRIPLAIAMEL